MSLARDIGFMKTSKTNKSIVFKLITSVVIIFILMLVITNYMITQKQIQMTENLLRKIDEYMPKASNSIIVTVNNAHLQSTADFRIYTFLVTGLVIILGSLIFALIIAKILKPLKTLQKNIGDIDINRPETFSDNLLIVDGSSEIVDLSNSFNQLMERIYKDYRKQKDFSANVAHELRTPVAVMKAQVDVYKRKNEGSYDHDFLEKIDQNLDKLKNLIESVLIFSKNQSLNISKVDINTLIEEILFDLEDKIASKNLSLNFVSEKNLILRTDDGLVQRLLFNIIENAIKYNRVGGKLDIITKSQGPKIIIEIIDTGIGMEKEDKEKIFDLFYQADKSRSVQGFGIGLALAKQIADSLDCKIKVLDNKPRGSRFVLEFLN